MTAATAALFVFYAAAAAGSGTLALRFAEGQHGGCVCWLCRFYFWSAVFVMAYAAALAAVTVEVLQ